MRKRWLLLAVLAACDNGEPGECIFNGLQMEGSADCYGFVLQADRMLCASERIFPGASLKGWQVELVDGPMHHPLTGERVGGMTYCWGRMVVEKSGEWRYGALAHEMAHALQCPLGDPTHATWGPLGIQAAIDAANSP
jgi:hypothetical protein